MFCHVQFCTLNVHINICFCMGFCHAYLCTNDYPYSYGFLSCTSLYEWLSISLCMGFRHAYFCTNDYPFLLNRFSSCLFLYEWLSISFWMGFRHAHFCTNDYHFFFNGFSSCTFLYEWLRFLFQLILVMHISVRMTTISFWMGFRHAHFCPNDYHLILNWFSSCTFLYEWLPFLFCWVFVIYISVRMTSISFSMDFRHAHFCSNDYYFFLNGFRHAYFCTNDYHFFLNGFSSCTFLYELLPFLSNAFLLNGNSVQYSSTRE